MTHYPEIPAYFATQKHRSLPFQVHLAHPRMADELLSELNALGAPVLAMSDRMIVTPPLDVVPMWSGTTWVKPEFVTVTSVSSAVKELRNRNRDWGLFSVTSHRRARLIQSQLSQKRAQLLPFPCELPKNPCGGWTPVSDDRLLVSATTTSPFLNGIPHFDEDHRNPPSRAYLKLWEFFTRFPHLAPKAGETVLDMGASPGGWTWVLAQLGCKVISVDKAPLAEPLQRHPRIENRRESAFGLRPQHIGKVDYFFSDIICYPEKLHELIFRWLDSGYAERFVCSVKFQGETDPAILERFRAIPGGNLIHLFQNGHEVTFYRV